jgi:Xaa-Pro aminopeptidase
MVNSMDYFARRQQLAGLLDLESLDAFLISNPINVTYLTGFSGDSSYLFMGRQQTVLISDSRYAQQIIEECPGLEVHIRPHSLSLPNATAELLGKLGLRKIGFESGHLTVAELESYREQMSAIDWKGARDRVENLREVKDPSEVDQIREAIGFAERAFTVFREKLRPEDCEKDLHDNMEMYVRRAGGRCTSFPTIVAVGERAALPHAPPTAKKVADAELLLIDWGARGRFYNCDLTRVLATRKIAAKLEKVYTVVLRAQTKALQAIRPGAKAKDIDAEARAVIEQAGFGQFFGHGLGHGLGLQVHEAPAIRQNSEAVLEAGMVFTIEPGIYLPDWGGVRIEDDVLVTPDGCEVLTHVPKEPIPILDFKF